MKSIRQFWRGSPPEYKDYLFIYSWGVIWSLVYLFATPSATFNVFNGTLIVVWTIVTAVGGILAAYGLITQDNLLVERFGVSLLMIGPLAFALTQLGIAWTLALEGTGEPSARLHLIFFALWPYLFLNKRRRQLKARVKLAKRLPLPEETGK